MADPLPAGSDVQAGAYRCNSCGQIMTTTSMHLLPPCPQCTNEAWDVMRRTVATV